MWSSGIWVTRIQLDVRVLQPFANQFENLLIGYVRVVETRCVHKNDARFMFFVVQNTNSFKFLSCGLEAFFSPL